MLGVTVIGSANVDVVVRCARIPRPGETVLGKNVMRFLGGKGANQAIAASRVADQVAFFATVGADASAEFVQTELKTLGLNDARIFIDRQAPTGTALIAVEDLGENSIIVVPGANDCWPGDAPDTLTIPTLCVSQFEIPRRTILQFFSRNRRLGGRNILNPAPFEEITPEILALVDLLILNESEYLRFRSIEAEAGSLQSLIREDLKNSNSPTPVIVTVGDQGVLFKSGKSTGSLRAHQVSPLDSTGAGDCFVGVYAALLSQKYDDVEAVRLANAAAALSVTRAGAAASMPTLSEIQDFARVQELVVEPL